MIFRPLHLIVPILSIYIVKYNKIMYHQQKYQPKNYLADYFIDISSDLPYLQKKRFGAKKSIFNKGDLIKNLYLIISGQVHLIYQDKSQIIPHFTIIGDFQPINQFSRRITQLKCFSVTKVIVLPFEYYFNIKQQIINQQRFIKQRLPVNNCMPQYLITKLFKKITFHRGQNVILQKQSHQDQSDHSSHLSKQLNDKNKAENLAIIYQGNFKIKKRLSIATIKKQHYEIQKQFQLVQIGPNQIVTQNCICDSPKGVIFFINGILLKKLCQNYQQIDSFLQTNLLKKLSHRRRCTQIQQACRVRSQLFNMIIPNKIKNQTEQYKQKQKLNMRKKHKTQQRLKIKNYEKNNQQIDKNYFKVVRGNQNSEMSCVSTDNNLAIFPILNPNPRTPKNIQNNIPRRKYSNIYYIKNVDSAQKQQYSPQDSLIKKRYSHSYTQEQQKPIMISRRFNNKFQRKMFIKAKNPFHHHKISPISQQVSMKSCQKPIVYSYQKPIVYSCQKIGKKKLSLSDYLHIS